MWRTLGFEFNPWHTFERQSLGKPWVGSTGFPHSLLYAKPFPSVADPFNPGRSRKSFLRTLAFAPAASRGFWMYSRSFLTAASELLLLNFKNFKGKSGWVHVEKRWCLRKAPLETEGSLAQHVSGEAADPCKLGTFILPIAMRSLLLYVCESKRGRKCGAFSQLWQKQKCPFLGQM